MFHGLLFHFCCAKNLLAIILVCTSYDIWNQVVEPTTHPSFRIYLCLSLMVKTPNEGSFTIMVMVNQHITIFYHASLLVFKPLFISAGPHGRDWDVPFDGGGPLWCWCSQTSARSACRRHLRCQSEGACGGSFPWRSWNGIVAGSSNLGLPVSTLWLRQNYYWKLLFIVDLPIENGDFP